MPTKSTITAILRRHRLIEPADASSTRRTGASSTNVPTTFGKWTSHIPVGSGGRCHPLTWIPLGVRACADEKTQTVHDHLTSIFRRYGMPDTILVDNGSPWGSDFYHPFTSTVWLVQLGVRVVHSRPYHPERFHRSLKTELLQGYTDLSHCQSSFDRWRDFYPSSVLTTPWTSIPLPADTPSALGLSRRPFRPSSTIPMTAPSQILLPPRR